MADLPLVIAFVILAAFTYTSGLRAPAAIAIVKDMLIWMTVIKFGALVFIVFIPLQYAINLQLLGGVWIIQTLPAVVIGLYTRWFHQKALMIGWLVGIVVGTALAAAQGFTPIYPLSIGGYVLPSYTALMTLVLNLIVAIVLTPIFNAIGAERLPDETRVEHYG